jgi:hypothetical protein
MDLTKSNQEVAMLKLQNGLFCRLPALCAHLVTGCAGSSEHQKILEQLKADNQSTSAHVRGPAIVLRRRSHVARAERKAESARGHAHGVCERFERAVRQRSVHSITVCNVESVCI